MKLKISTYNIFHCEDFLNEVIDFDAFADVINGFGSDVVGLNEVYGEGTSDEYDEQAEILGKKIGCNYFFAKAIEIGNGNPFGNAVLSRLPIKECKVIPIPDPEQKKYDGYYETRCVLKMVTATEPELTFLITHFGLNPDEQENAIKTVLENLEKERCILMGDLNLSHDDDMLKPIRAALKDAAAASPTLQLTFPSDKPTKIIDFIFVTDDIKVNSFYAEDVVLSDHKPVSAEIEVY